MSSIEQSGHRMIRILFLVDKHPCPPTNGVYVPLFELICRLKEVDDVHLELVLPTESKVAETDQMGDTWFSKIHLLPVRKKSIFSRLANTVTFRWPPYIIDLEFPEKFPLFHMAIATPDGLALSLFSLKLKNANLKTVLWINEPYYTVSLGEILNGLSGCVTPIRKLISALIKLPIIYLCEKNYLARMDGAVVQTSNELARLERMIGSGGTRGYVCANPLKKDLLNYTRSSNKYILLSSPRSLDEVAEFVHRLSPILTEKMPDIFIRLCTSKTSTYQIALSHFVNVSVIGYRENIADIYEDVFCSVVFTRQRYGLVNRVKEAMTAGVAVIAYPEALATLGDVEDGKNVVAASNCQEFVDRTLELASDLKKSEQIGVCARKFIIQNENQGPDELISTWLKEFHGTSGTSLL